MAALVPFDKNNKPIRRESRFVDLYSMIDELFADTWLSRRGLLNDTFKIDVRQNEKDYLVEAELPGIKKDEINIELNDGRLSISVSREENIEEDNKDYIHRERRYNSMRRSVYLPDAKSDKVNAKLENGVLKITVPKEARPDNTLKIDIE